MLAVWGSGVTPHSLLRAPGDLVSPSECTYIYVYIYIPVWMGPLGFIQPRISIYC